MKKLVYHVAAFVMLSVLFASCSQDRTVKIVSYNVGTFTKFEENSMSMIADMMKELGADAVSMNELDSCTARTGRQYQLEQFASRMGGWQYRFGSAMPYDGGSYGDGLAVPRDSKVLDAWSVRLPQAGGAEPRALVVMELDGYVMASTHLDHVSDSARVEQAKVITEVLKDRYGKSGKPVFLCGDMNARPGSAPMREFAREWKFVTQDTPTFPSGTPDVCIDYILALDNGAEYEVVQTSVPQEFSSGDTAKASDHLPVLAEIRL